jgi:hypothetical protein
MSGLIKDDITVLQYYADNGMRERYWNYLGNKTDERYADNGYGQLAMNQVDTEMLLNL